MNWCGALADLLQSLLLVALKHCPYVDKDLRGEQVDTAVDNITHKCAGLLYVMQGLKKGSIFWD